VVLGLLIAGLVMGLKLQLFQADGTLVPYYITATVVTVLMFVFSLWVSCHHSRCARIVLAVFFLIYALALVALAIIAFIRKNSITDDIAKLWTGGGEGHKTAVRALEKAFECSGWETPNASSPYTRPCNGVIGPAVKKYWQIAAGVLLAFGVLLVVAIVFAFKLACGETDESVELKSQGNARYTDPLDAAGSTTDSKGPYKYTW
jgi:hypothetical protein